MVADKTKALCDDHAAACATNKRLRAEVKTLRYLVIKMHVMMHNDDLVVERSELRGER
jgi:hypothetical protein